MGRVTFLPDPHPIFTRARSLESLMERLVLNQVFLDSSEIYHCLLISFGKSRFKLLTL
jgi:hypothetical protein